jgi:molecular chaperone HtpG
MNIPLIFKEKIDADLEISGHVYIALAHFEKLIKVSKFEFFSDYTNHGIEHIESVLYTAEELIGESIKWLNSKDIAVLILSIVLHDLGMHITFEGFQSLLRDNQQYFEQSHAIWFAQLPWQQEWQRYYEETRHWDEKKIVSVFGKMIIVRDPFAVDKDSLTEHDKKLIGEFIRRYHPRLAHEIILKGFPAINNSFIPFASGINDELRDITGLLARSHGLDMRSTLDYMKSKYGDYRTPCGVKIVFLMVVLRIADYLHITSERAPVESLQIRSISSPLSIKEWNLHNSIKHTHRNHDDPETFFVQVKPETSEMYLKVERLLKDIQRELDLSWAILGEVYGRINDLKSLTISIRRIRSNLDDKSFAEQVDYIPEAVVFASDPAVLKLLISPLYGDNPTYGVRELLQNSLDACKEREHILFSQTRGGTSPHFIYEPKIKISIEENLQNDFYFVIRDNGIGMTKDTIINFFFKAGASFRNSRNWLKTFSDEEGQSLVQRSGRFGIGVLASFLIGNELEVNTRHFNDNIGLKFTTKIDDEQIELKKEVLEIGTTVKICIKKEAIEKLREQVEQNYYSEVGWFEWFRLDNSIIEIEIPKDWNSDGVELYKKSLLKEISGWHNIYPDGFGKVSWKYMENKRNLLLCNGIVITNGYRFSHQSYPSFDYNHQPTLLVKDNDGNLPLSLNRNSIDNRLPFEDELKIDICKDIIAQLIVSNDFCKIHNLLAQINENQLLHPALSFESIPDRASSVSSGTGEGKLLFFEEGYTLLHKYTLNILSQNIISWFWLKNSKHLDFKTIHSLPGMVFSKYAVSEYRSILKDKIYMNSIVQDSYNIISKRIFITKTEFQRLHDEKGNIRMKKDIRENLVVEEENNLWLSVILGNPPTSTINLDFLSDHSNQIDIAIENYISPRTRRKSKKIESKDYMLEMLNQYFGGDVVIPYDLEERRKKFPKAFHDLKEYMEKYL